MADWALVHRERRALIALFRGLEGPQWQVPSLCPGWTVHDVLAHLASALDASTATSVRAVVAARGRPAALIEHLAAAYAGRPSAELVDVLESHAESRFAPPVIGWRASLTDVMVHRTDVAVPLGIDPHRPPEAWRPVLELLTSRLPMLGSIRGGRPPVTWRTTDLDWRAGDGLEVSGPAAALGPVLAGRAALLDGLAGPGLPAVRAWLS